MLVNPWARVSWISRARRVLSSAMPASCDNSSTSSRLDSSCAISAALCVDRSITCPIHAPNRIAAPPAPAPMASENGRDGSSGPLRISSTTDGSAAASAAELAATVGRHPRYSIGNSTPQPSWAIGWNARAAPKITSAPTGSSNGGCSSSRSRWRRA